MLECMCFETEKEIEDWPWHWLRGRHGFLAASQPLIFEAVCELSGLRMTTVLVRSHNPSAARMARMRDWHRSLADAGMCMHISVDVTHGRNAADSVLA